MKLNKLLFIIWIYILSFDIALWNCESCKIQKQTPEIITNYIQNYNTILSNIALEVSKNTPKDTDEISTQIKSVTKNMTEIFNVNVTPWGYFTYFEFYTMWLVWNLNCPQVRRDHDLVKALSDKIDALIKNYQNSWYFDITLKKDNICKDNSWNAISGCNYSWDLYEVLSKLQTNNQNLLYFYRKRIMYWDNYSSLWKTLNLIWDDFVKTFEENYDENTINNCNSCSWNGVAEMLKKIKNIKTDFTNADGSDWRILAKLNDDWYEAEVLSKWLDEMWVSSSVKAKMLKNLEDYNNWKKLPVLQNLYNTFVYFKKSFTSQIDTFWTAMTELFKQEKEVTLWQLNKSMNDEEIKKNIEIRLNTVYSQELPWIKNIDTSTMAVYDKQIKMFKSLKDAIKKLNDTIEISEKVCNSQWAWLGVCSYK